MIDVIDAAGNIQNVGTLPALGVAAASGSVPFIGSTESATYTGTITSTNGTTVAAVVPTGTAVAGSEIQVSSGAYNTATIQITGTLTGVTLTVQGTLDNTNWVTVGTLRLQTFAGTTVGASSIGATGIYTLDINGLTKFRLVSTALSAQSPLIPTGSSVNATITMSSQIGPPMVFGSINTVSAITAANLGIPSVVADAVSAALATTTTTASIAPSFGVSYEVNFIVTAVSGTAPTLDVIIQESDDSGTNWFDIYHFERITAIGAYRSPKLPLTGNRIRYVQLVGGISPSFTRSINRLQSSDTAVPIRRFFERGLNSAPVALNHTSVTLATGGVFTFTGNTTPIAVGNKITITGTFGGTGSITGYITGNDYIVISTNGTTTATLVSALGTALTTTAGTPTGLTFTANELAVNNFTSTYSMGNPSKNLQLIISSGTLTTAPSIKLQGSDDGGIGWYDIPGATLTAVASSVVQVTVANIRAQLVRGLVTSAGSGATLNYVCVKVYD